MILRLLLGIIALLLVDYANAKNLHGIFRMSFSEAEDSTLITPMSVFNEYKNDLSDCDTKITIPNDFEPIDLRTSSFYIRSSPCFPDTPQSIYPLGLQNRDKSVMMLFPTLYFDMGNETLRRGAEIEKEIRANFKDCDLDVNPYVAIYNVKGKKNAANADTLAIYELNPKNCSALYSEEFPYCIGIYLRKAEHPGLLLKLLLNKDTYTDKEKYIKLMLDTIKYGDNSTRLTMIEEQLKGHYTDLGFPSVPRHPYKAQPVMDEISTD
ncbi:MAG: hypothetical protein K2I89_04200 [Muribaculaceae bacterium]|nr:hypothetical protein [Muribaculaceae bacterium]MDE5594758.1 hypothetical protein [Muribaculaceae bacterium]